MTNRNMVKQSLLAKSLAESPAHVGTAGLPEPNRTKLPPMPAPEGSSSPVTLEDPIDSPQPNNSAKRTAPGPDRIGLSTRRDLQ